MHAVLRTYNLSEYAEVEAASEIRFELVDGQLVAMAGGTIEHADMIAEVTSILRAALASGPCRVTSSDLRVGHDASAFRAYPDVVVRCEPAELSPLPPKDTLLNPTLIVEVTSDRTEKYDRGDKLRKYQQMESLEAIVIVSHRERCISIHRRRSGGSGGWEEVEHRTGAYVELMSGTVRFSVDDVYERAMGTPGDRRSR